MVGGDDKLNGSGISGSNYAAQTRKLISLITDLRALGYVYPYISSTRNQLRYKLTIRDSVPVPKPISTSLASR